MPSFPKIISTRLTTRLITAFILAIVITAFVAAVPAYLLLRNELQNQTVALLSDGVFVTKTLMEVDKTRLIETANLAAERPSLHNLLGDDDREGLSEYLGEFKKGAGLDFYFVRNSAGEFIAGDFFSDSCLPIQPVGAAVFYSPACLTPQIVMLTSQEVRGDLEDLFYITVGKKIDNNYAVQLAKETGFEQNFIVDQIIVATSINELSGSPASPRGDNLENTGINLVNLKTINGDHYYSTFQKLSNDIGEKLIINEVVLQVESLYRANQRALLFIISSAFLIALAGSIVGVLFARNLIKPLNELTSAARNISTGDFSSPIPIPQEPYEISILAAAFEESRSNTLQYMDELSRAKAWSETVIRSISEAIVTYDDQFTITSFNRSAQEITGWLSEEANGKPLDEILRLPEKDGVFSLLIPPIGGKTQIELLTRTGRRTSFEVTVAQLIPASDEAFQTALVMRDITEEEATKSLQSYFLANISHEFRTPLSALNASVELMLDEIELLNKSEINELLNSIHRSVTGLQTLIDNLLESTRIQAGRYHILRQLIEFGDVVKEATRIMKPLLERRRQELIIKQSDPDQVVLIDPTRMTQVLVNLLSNASKYSPMDSSIELIISKVNASSLEVQVADRGIGISPTDVDNIFRRFVRLSDQDGAQYGIGLGLSVVKAIIDEHHGEVGVRTNPGGGSIFWFRIPIKGNNA
jgi:PAS domain S-box-containing protein